MDQFDHYLKFLGSGFNLRMVTWLKKNKISRGKLAELSGISSATVGVR